MKARPPPNSPPPLSTEEMAVIKKRVAPPKGPPPAGLSSFKGPKRVEEEEYYNRTGYRGDRSYYTDSKYDDKSPIYDDCHGHEQRFRQSREDERVGSPRHNEMEENRGFHRSDDDHEGLAQYSRRDENRDHIHSMSDDKWESGRREDALLSKNGGGREVRSGYRANPVPVSDDKIRRGDRDMESEDAVNIETKSDVLSVRTADTISNTGKDKIFMFRRVLRASFRDLRTFVTSPCEPKTVVRCYVERNRNGSNYLTPVYSLCADLEDGTGRELITCRKVFKSRSSHYIFSLKAEDLYRKREQRSRMYLGKLRSISDMEYILYDNGVCDTMPQCDTKGTANETIYGDATHGDGDDEDEDYMQTGNELTPHSMGSMKSFQSAGTSLGNDEDSSLYRTHLAVIRYNSRVRPTEVDERGMEVCIPQVHSSSTLSPGAPSPPNSVAMKTTDLLQSFRKIRELGRQNDLYHAKCFVMHEKRSRYDPLSSCLVDFQGRATMASVKNFQLIYSTPESTTRSQSPTATYRPDTDIIFQMGKITNECFNVDFKYPLSMLQAFAIAVSRFDAKLTW